MKISNKSALRGGVFKKSLYILFLFVSLLLISFGCSREKNTTSSNYSPDYAIHLKNSGKYDSSLVIYKYLMTKTDTVHQAEKYKGFLLEVADLYRLMGKFNAAGDVLQSIGPLTGNDSTLVIYYLTIGKLNYDSRRYSAAIDYFRKALGKCINTSRGKFYKSECFASIGKCSLSMNNFSEAEKYFRIAFSFDNDSLFSENRIIRDYINFGLYYLALGDYGNSLKNFQLGLDLSGSKAENQLDKASILNGIGIVCFQKSDYEEAVRFLNDALKIRKKVLSADHYLTADIYGNLGMVYVSYAEPEIAKDLYERALNTRIKVFGDQSIIIARTYNNLANVSKDLGRYDRAEAYYLRAIRIMEKSSPGSLDLGITMGNLGDVESHNRNYQESIKHFNASIKILDSCLGEDHPYTALTIDNLGLAYARMGNSNKAVKYHTRALHIAEKVYPNLHHPLLSQILNELGDVEEKKNNFNSALNYYQESLSNLFISLDKNYANNPGTEALRRDMISLETLSNKARVLYLLYKKSGKKELLELSVKTYNLVDITIDNIRAGFREESSRLLLSEKTYGIFNDGITVLSEAYKNSQPGREMIEKAFSFCEKNKALNLLETLIETKTTGFSGIPDTLLTAEHRLQYRISLLEENLFQEQLKESPDNHPVISTLKNSILDLKKQYYNLIDNYKKNYSKYYSLKFRFDPTTIKDIQEKVLGKDDAIIEYFPGIEKLFIFIITRDTFNLKTVELNENLSDLANNFRSALSENNFTEFTLNSYKLYQKLIEPAIGFIRGKNLIVIPDGVLNYIPFDALVTSVPDSRLPDYRKLHYLVFDHKISYGFSASLLTEDSVRKRKDEPDTFIGFAPY